MTPDITTVLATLTQIQRQAVEWDHGALLVLAGPGSGKTQVLTCRIAKLLDASKSENFRVLALTFTNKAADEMKTRVATFAPGLEDRAVIGTFHSFCAQMLRQHGVHLGINPDFAIYSSDDDRRAVLEDALIRASSEGKDASPDAINYLPLIDRLKTRLIAHSAAETALAGLEEREQVLATYELYEQELRRLNALDFNSLIFEAYRLATTFPAIAARYRRSHPYWLIDEFQDTNNAQYRFIRALAGEDFRNVFAVADDDQILYAWNGASYRQIESFLADFSPKVLQLPTNYRCPPAIVEAANRLVVYNLERTPSKCPLIPGKTQLKYPPSDHIQLRIFDTAEEEANMIAQELADRGRVSWSQTTVLARTRALLEGMHTALRQQNVPCVLAQRRDDFLSPEFRWLVAVLRQLSRPLDRRNLTALVESFNRMVGTSIATDQVVADAEATGRAYITTWLDAAKQQPLDGPRVTLLQLLETLATDISSAKKHVAAMIEEFARSSGQPVTESDLTEDLTAWRELTRDIQGHIGKNAPLDQFLQELQLRSKEPTPKPETVTLMTIHGAKGKEFDIVYVIGLAEDIMPSYQSKKKGDGSPEMEEERRNCFVAITRAKECLVLSRATHYRGWVKEPSRFLVEMGLAS